MKKKILLIAALVGVIVVGGAKAAHAATYTSYVNCSVGKSVSLHVTGNRLSDGGVELKVAMANGDVCYLTSNGSSIGLKTQGIRVI